MTSPRIALIEDDSLQQLILRTMLEEKFSVRVYGGYAEALHDFRHNDQAKPDLILCDMTLPEGDGMTLRRELQKYDELQACPFIFLTSLEDGPLKRQAIDSGIDDYLRKPIEKEALIAVLDRTLKRSQQLQIAAHEHLNHQLTEPLQPNVPERLGPYRLMLTHQQVAAGGGDFVFHLRAVDTDFVLLGDVMGHGAPAKFFLHAYAGYLYGMVQSFRHYQFTPTAAELLHILNRTLATDSFLQRWLLTCVVVCLPPSGELSLAHAGHPFSWLVTKDNLKPIGGQSVMPGLLKETTYTNIPIQLSGCERLLLTTDGVAVNARAHGDLGDLTALSSAELSRRLMARADARDDATLLLIERV